jgi:hypothetical protein
MFSITRPLLLGALLVAAAVGLAMLFIQIDDSSGSQLRGPAPSEPLAPESHSSERLASLFRFHVEMRSAGKIQSIKKIKMIVGPGVISESTHRYPVKIEVEDQASSTGASAKAEPIYLDVFWHQDGHVSSFNWRNLAIDHEGKKMQDLWWLLSNRLSGDPILSVPVDGVFRKYKYVREDLESITRLPLVASKSSNTSETWKLTAARVASPHQLTKLEAVQNYTIPAMQGRSEQRFSVHVSASREDYPVDAIDFLNENNDRANEVWAKAKATGDERIAEYIRLNGGLVIAFNRTHNGGNRANIDVLGSYLIRKATDRDIFQALLDPNMDEGAKADLILALQLQQEPRAEELLLRLAKMSDSQPGNAFRAVIALGQRQTTSLQAVQTLADLAVYKTAPDPSVANNALLQMAYLSQIDSTQYGKVVEKTLADYSKSAQMIPDLLLQAQTATKSPVYRDAAIDAIAENGSFMGKPTDMQIMTSAAKLVGTQAVLGDFKSINHIKSNVLKVENPGILPYYTGAYGQMPVDPAIDAGIREKILSNQPENLQAAYFGALAGSPERCKHNEQFIRGAVNAAGTNASIKRMLQQACGF